MFNFLLNPLINNKKVAGSKKLANKKVLNEVNGNVNRANNNAKKDLSKMPKIETLRMI